MTGTLLNTIVVILAGIAGALIGNRLPAKIRETGMHGIGLTTLLIGLQMALGARNLLVVLGSLVVGGAVGEILGIETGLETGPLGREPVGRTFAGGRKRRAEARHVRPRFRHRQPGILRGPDGDHGRHSGWTDRQL